jgi:raffinose/stachyose/melibiose transport system permease protein
MTRLSERVAAYVFLSFFAVITLFPILGVISVALTPEGSPVAGFSLSWPPHFENFVSAWSAGQFGQDLRSSAIIAVPVVIVSSALSILTGYAFGTMRFRGSSLLFYILLAGLVVPIEAMMIPLYYDLRRIGLVDDYWSVILPDIGISMAFGTFWMRAFFLSTPRSLLEAARIDGASTWRTLVRILVPTARPAIFTMMLLLFMWTWNDFLFPLVMLQNPNLATAPLGIANFIGKFNTDQQGLAAGAVIVALPIVVLYFFSQRHFIRGMLSGASRL